eukprot:s43_g32.t1
MWALIFVLSLCLAEAGWPRSKGGYSNYGPQQSNYTRGQSSWGWRSSHHRHSSSMQETLTMCLAERLLGGDKHKRKSSRSPSPQSSECSMKSKNKVHRRTTLSSSERAELKMLRDFKAKCDAELAEKQAVEMHEKLEQKREQELAALEERILQAIPRPHEASVPPSAANPLLSKQKKLVEALLNDTVVLSEEFTWKEVEEKIAGLKSDELKEVMTLRHMGAVPRGKPARVGKVMKFLKDQCGA